MVIFHSYVSLPEGIPPENMTLSVVERFFGQEFGSTGFSGDRFWRQLSYTSAEIYQENSHSQLLCGH